MASWMIHLRIAEEILKHIPTLPREPFILGNIAPDSGIPAPDGRSYIPDKSISHFATTNSEGRMYHGEAAFIAQYMTPTLLHGKSHEAYAFYLGYLAHLYTDNAWIEHIYELGKTRLAHLRAQSKALFASRLKQDWYTLDFLFLQKNPHFSAYETYRTMPCIENTYLDFFSPTAFEERRHFILSFYEDGVSQAVDTSHLYLTPQELDAFVLETATQVRVTYAQLFNP